jgi:hypothetical protein
MTTVFFHQRTVWGNSKKAVRGGEEGEALPAATHRTNQRSEEPTQQNPKAWSANTAGKAKAVVSAGSGKTRVRSAAQFR